MTRERSGCWALTATIVIAMVIGALAGGVVGGGVAYWLARRVAVPPPTPTLEVRPNPTAISSPVSGVVTLEVTLSESRG